MVPQPEAKPGQRTYCPVSGVVFRVQPASPRRQVGARSLYFCCEGCAGYFAEHADRVVAQRHFAP